MDPKVTDKPKRGRKSKKESQLEEIEKEKEKETETEKEVVEKNDSEEKNVIKKRGRKPKGGKIVEKLKVVENAEFAKPNIILHLKCSLKDLQQNSNENNPVESYNNMENNFKMLNSDTTQSKAAQEKNNNCEDNSEIKEIWKKIKALEHNLHINNVYDKKSACFWCTHDFDNPPIYIPKLFIKNSYDVYGCFCSPECGTAFLMEENIDISTKFERYHLLNHIYAKIYNYKQNIKPAPNPYYMLDKFYGNLSIQEYRSLFKFERLFLIVDKPLTRVLPELHEDNDEFILNSKLIPSNNYQIKKKLQKKMQNKTDIINDKFGLT